jgi:hypothetical protein
MTLNGFFQHKVLPSVEKLEKTIGVRKTIDITQESEETKLENALYWDQYKNDGKKHYVFIPF